MSTTRRLLAVIWPFLLTVLALLLLAETRAYLLSGVRAYATGESHWSQAKAGAFRELGRYARGGDEQDYQAFLDQLAIIEGDHVARMEMLKPEFDYARARRGLIAGGNDPSDIGRMIRLFRLFHDSSGMEQVLAAWRQGDEQMQQLWRVAEELHALYAANPVPDAAKLAALQARIDATHAAMESLSTQFSNRLRVLSRQTQDFIRIATLAVALLLVVVGAIVAWRAARRQQRAEMALRVSEERHQLVLEGINDGIWDWDLVNDQMYFSPRVYEMLGYTRSKLDSSADLEHVIVDFDRARTTLETHIAAGDGKVLRRILRMRTADGRVLTVLSRSITRHDSEGKALRVAGSYTDISEQVENENRLRLAASVFDAGYEGIVITDADNRVVEANKAFLALSGYRMDQLAGKPSRELYAPEMPEADLRQMRHSVAETGSWRGEVVGRKRSGEDQPLEISIVTVRDDAGKVLYRINACRDIAERKYAQARIQHLAYFDALTGLPNRSYLGTQFDQLLADAQASGNSLAVGFLDLDGFKEVNDTLGHSAGDTLLRRIAQRLREQLGEGDLLCRFGGDEFLLVLPNCDAETAHHRLTRLIEHVRHPVPLEGRNLALTASAGFSLYPNDAIDAENLVREADLALYRAKQKGKNIVARYEDEMGTAVAWRQDMLGALHKAVAEEQFVLRFQPVMNILTGRVGGVEALVYWNHPEHGIISPASFIPLAEETGLIEQLGSWVVDEALACYAQWRADDLPHFYLAINLSGFQLRSAQAVREHIVGVAARRQVAITDVVLEITERQIVYDFETSLSVLTSLSAHGIGLAIDDFGTGYSSLEYLRQLPVTQIKIDMTFIRNMVAEVGDRAIVNAIIGLGRSLRLQVVAEGVETREQLDILRECGCHLIQGFYFSRPLPADRLAAYVRTLDEQARQSKSDQAVAASHKP